MIVLKVLSLINVLPLTVIVLSNSHNGVPQQAQWNVSIVGTVGTESVCPSPLQFEEERMWLTIVISVKTFYTTYVRKADLITKYFILSKANTDECGMKYTVMYDLIAFTGDIHSLRLVGYLLVQADTPWHNYYSE